MHFLAESHVCKLAAEVPLLAIDVAIEVCVAVLARVHMKVCMHFCVVENSKASFETKGL